MLYILFSSTHLENLVLNEALVLQNSAGYVAQW